MLFSLFAIPLVLEALIAFLFKKKYITNAILLIVLGYCMLNSPARGLTINLIIASILVCGIFLHHATLKKIITLCTIFTGLILGTLIYARFFITPKHEAAIQRLSNFDPSGTSVNNRLTSIKVAWEQWKDHIFFGTGTDSIAYFNNDPGLYTHNVILEIIFEYGLIGAIPLFALIFVSLICFYSFMKNLLKEQLSNASVVSEDLSQKIWFAGMFIVLFLFSMTSGTLGTMRPFWIFLALSIGEVLGKTDSKALNNKNKKQTSHTLNTLFLPR
jgi:O-antigen ligase